MAGIFGDFLNKFKFTDEKQDERAHSNQIAVDNDDGAIQVDADSISQFAMNLDWTYSNQAELIETYREVANYSLVDFAIEDIVGEMVSFDEDQDPVKIDLGSIDDKELSESIKQKVYESWDKVAQILDLKQTINRRAKQFYIDGRLAYQKVIDQKKPADGLLDVIELDTRFVTKYRGVKYDRENRVIDGIEEYFLYDESNGKRQNTKETERNQQFKEALQLNPKSITYVTSGLTDPKTGYAISWLHKAVKPANQLRMMENALVIYRITRAPERRIFYVDTANLPKSKAEQYLRSLKNNYRNRMSFDPDSGTFKDQRHLQTMQEDYWLPRNSSGRGTEVSTLPGGCLAMDTKVSLLDGREISIKEIEDEMNEGKTLWTYSVNPETGRIVPGIISWAGVTQKSAKVMKLTLDNGEEIVCTLDHKFPVNGKGFMRADELSVGESMMALYRKRENIAKNKMLDYEQFFDNEEKEWKYTHRVVADLLRDKEVFNYVYESNNENSFDVRHHIDFNRFNNDPSNLCFMSWRDHSKLHTDFGFSEEAQKLGTEAARQRLIDMKENNPEEYEEYCKRISERHSKWWENLTDEQYDEITSKQSKALTEYIANLSEVEREKRDSIGRESLLKANRVVTERRKNDKKYNEWFSQRQSSGWTDEMRNDRSEWATEFNTKVKWGKNKEISVAKHKEKQKVMFSHEMLLYVIDLIKDKTTHQVTVKDVVSELNKNFHLVEQLQEINKDKSVPNWKPEVGFTETLVKKIPIQFGYSSWIDFRKKESIHNHRIVKIEYLEDEIEVGTLTIDQEEKYHDYHTFALSCGIFTKNSNLSDIEDVLYFQKQLYKALNIPISRLESDSMMPLGRSAEISRDELKFSKFVSKIRKRFNIMFLDLLKTELVLGKVITGKEWDEIEQKIEFKYALDMYIEELKQSEMIRDRLDLAREYEPHVGKYVPHSYIRREILKQTEEDIKELDKEIQEEKNNEQFYPPEGEEGGGFGGRQF